METILTQEAVERISGHDFNSNGLSPAEYVSGCICLVCGCYGVDRHHVLYGTANRAQSERYGLVVPLCRRHHEEVHGNPNKGLDLLLKRTAQEYFEKHYGDRALFVKTFGRSWE